MSLKITLLLLFAIFSIQAQVGIGTTNPNNSSELEINSVTKGLLIPRMTLAQRNAIVAPATSLLIYQTNNTSGYYYYNGITWLQLNTSNYWKKTGTNLDVANTNDDIVFSNDQTSIIFAAVSGVSSPMMYMFNGGGNTGNRMFLAHSLASPTWGIEYNDTDDAFNFLANGSNRLKIDLSGNSALTVYNSAIFNENGGNFDFRVESNNETHAFFVDANADVVRIGDANGSLDRNGITTNGITVDYLLDVDNGQINGSTIGIGSVEHITDGNTETIFSDWVTPRNHLINDLGYDFGANPDRYWDDVYADSYLTPSDIRLKKDIHKMPYGLKEILALETISYILKEDPFQEPKIGLSAQQTLKLIPEAVKTHNYKVDEAHPNVYKKEKLKSLAMSYGTLIPVLVKSIQEQNELIKSLEKRIQKLEKESKN